MTDTTVGAAGGSAQGEPAKAGPALTAPGAVAEWTLRAAWEALLGADPPLAPALLDALVQGSECLELPGGQLALSMHEPARHLVLLLQGDAMVGSLPAVGAQGPPTGAGFQTERTVSGLAWLDAASAWRGQTHAHDVHLASEARLARLPIEVAERIVVDHPDFARRMLGVLADQIDGLCQATRDLLHKDAEARFAVWLVQRLPAGAAPGAAVTLMLGERKRDIAAQLGITPETLSRLQRALVRKGVIDVMGYSVRVLDVARLMQIAAA